MAEQVQSFWAAATNIFAPHGPATRAGALSFSSGDVSIHFFLQLAIILIACRPTGWIARKLLHQPQVVGEMIAGIVLGPSLFGLLMPGLQAAIFFPVETRNVLYAGSQLGVGLYMFLIGTQFRPAKLRSRARSAAAVSAAGIMTPFAVAALIAPLLIGVPGLFAANISPANATLFLGACIALTAFPMLARIIDERGLADSPVGTLSLAAGAFDDACSWCVLAIVLAAFGGGPGVAILAIGGGLLWTLFVVFAGPIYSRRSAAR